MNVGGFRHSDKEGQRRSKLLFKKQVDELAADCFAKLRKAANDDAVQDVISTLLKRLFQEYYVHNGLHHGLDKASINSA
ncbi:MAG: hypothetical protein H0U39_04750 [Segetibacter sp.]|nr:hypothetical protein [Segetibacter sp.]